MTKGTVLLDVGGHEADRLYSPATGVEGVSPGLPPEEPRLSTELELGEWMTAAMEPMAKDLKEAIGRLPAESLFLLSSRAAWKYQRY